MALTPGVSAGSRAAPWPDPSIRRLDDPIHELRPGAHCPVEICQLVDPSPIQVGRDAGSPNTASAKLMPSSTPRMAASYTMSWAVCLPTRSAKARMTGSANTKPCRTSMLALIRSVSTSSPSTRMAAYLLADSVMLQASGMAIHSAFQARPSRSWSWIIASVTTAASARTRRARVSRCSDSSGLRFWGIVILPTVPGMKGSRTSPNSSRCNSMISLPILAMVVAAMASRLVNSAGPSRLVIQGIEGTPRSMRRANASNSGRARSPQNSIVPRAPPN